FRESRRRRERRTARSILAASGDACGAYARRLSARCGEALRARWGKTGAEPRARGDRAISRNVARRRTIGSESRANAVGVARVLSFFDRARSGASRRSNGGAQGAEVAEAIACGAHAGRSRPTRLDRR